MTADRSKDAPLDFYSPASMNGLVSCPPPRVTGGPGRLLSLLAALLAPAFLATTSCNNDMALVELEPIFDDWNLEGAELRESLRLDGAGETRGYVTETIPVGDLVFDRVGLMFDSERTPKVDVRVSMDGGRTFTEWAPATITFRESIAHNAHADVPVGGTHIEVRFSEVDREDLSFLFVDAFVFTPDPVASGEELEGLEVLQQELAADQGVDVTRSQWGARPSGCSVTHTPYRMTIHHTVTASSDPALRMRQMQNYHMDNRGYCDLGYHFCVGSDGRVYQGRPERYRGAHVGGANTGNAGISFIGNYCTSTPSSSMMNAGAKIVWAVADYYGIAINRDRVKGHREYSATACPGNNIYSRMNDLVALAQAYPGNGTTPTQGVLRGAIYHGEDLQNMSNRIQGATVSLNTGPSTTTCSEGWYAFDLDPGSYTVNATATGFSTESLSRDVTSGQTTWGSIRLYPEATGDDGTVRGVVFWVDDPSEYDQYVSDASRRISGATVTFTPGDHTATTGGDGYYEIAVPAGTYSVRASADGYDDGVRPEDVTVTAGAVSWGSTHVIRPGEEVVIPAPTVPISDPPDGAQVSLDRIEVSGTVSHSADLVSFTVQGEDVDVEGGAFQASVELSAGENLIEAVAEDSEGQIGEDSITVYFDAPAGGIDGFVYDASEGDEARIFGATVSIPEIDAETVTDAVGAFGLDLEGGTYTLVVSADEYVTHRGAITVVAGRRMNLRIGLEPGSDAVEDLVEFVFPVDGEILGRREIIATAAAAVPDLSRATINGIDAELGNDEMGSFTAVIQLEPGENSLEAIAYRAGDEEAGRASITVTYSREGCGCASGAGAASTALLITGLFGILLLKGSRRNNFRDPRASSRPSGKARGAWRA